jgi:hypothetical protein
MKKLFLLVSIFFVFHISSAQTQQDSVKLDTRKILSLALDADITSALNILETDSTKLLSEQNKKMKTVFETRFKYSEDKSTYLEDRSKFGINDLLKIYSEYWRVSLLNKEKNYDTLLGQNLFRFFINKYSLKNLNVADSLITDTLDYFLKKYIGESGLMTTGFGKTGKLMDLLVWKNQADSVYKFNLGDEELKVKVVFMTEFASLGWEDYATFGTYFPGGWATDDALFCVKDAYDLSSEIFLVSYLAHESRHFRDYKLFNNKLSGAELEYRAKLTELSFAKTILQSLISFFITNANYESDNAHNIADYCVIRDLSMKLFKSDFEKDIKKWEVLSAEEINNASLSVLKENTEMLKKEFKHFILK